MAQIPIRPLDALDIDDIVALALSAWAPVFESFREVWGHDLYDRFFPDWKTQQAEAVREALDSNDSWVSEADSILSGFVNIAFDETERAAEIYMVAVDPRFQRKGIATALIEFSLSVMRQRGMTLATVATGADPGHGPARQAYEKTGFKPIHQVLYAKILS